MGLFNLFKRKKGCPQTSTNSSPVINNTAGTPTRRICCSVSDFSKYYQKWDENYNKELGYEYFKICTQPWLYPFYGTLASRLTNARKSTKLTQKEAAQSIGISASALSSYENGYTVPADDNLKLMSKIYNIPFDFLKNGFVYDLSLHIRLALICNEEEYITSLRISAKAAEQMFPELLTEQDKETCQLVNSCFEKKV